MRHDQIATDFFLKSILKGYICLCNLTGHEVYEELKRQTVALVILHEQWCIMQTE